MPLVKGQTQYRPDIDGLRAIAVLSVLFHHLNPSILPGGFIGVDIFFVISGFLITSQIYLEALKGKFTLKKFYQRRINRIVPALLFLVIATLISGLVLLSPSDLLSLLRSSLFAMIGLSNIYFWQEYGNYFALDTNEAPLLHTWSLGVEEQFYLLWPLMLLILIKFKRIYMLGILATLTIIAIIFSETAIKFFASASYYMLPTRFFELMSGGALAIIFTQRTPPSNHVSFICTISGLIMIGTGFYFLNKTSTYPGINALWPCIGAALVIWAGPNNNLASKLLTSRFMIFIGLISYSLYLWHWPIISYIHYVGLKINFIVGCCIIFLSIFMAWVSWKFIERPMRQTGVHLTFSTVFIQRFALPVTGLTAIFSAIAYSEGLPQRFDPIVANLEKFLEFKPDQSRHLCHVPTAMYKTLPNASCRLGTTKPELDGLMIGDSFANHFTGMVDILASSSGLSIMDYTMDGCPPLKNYTIKKSKSYAEKCKARNDMTYSMIQSNPYKLVVLAAHWPYEPETKQYLIDSIEAILNTGSKVTLILNNTSIENAHSCPIKRAMYKTDNNCDARQEELPHYFAEISSRFPQVHFIDPNQIICNEQNCSPILQNTLLYRDSSHLNELGSRLIGELLIQKGISLVTVIWDHSPISRVTSTSSERR